MPDRVQWEDAVHEVRYATSGKAVVITGCGRRAPTGTTSTFTRSRAKFGRLDGPPCEHGGCRTLREKRLSREADEQLDMDETSTQWEA